MKTLILLLSLGVLACQQGKNSLQQSEGKTIRKVERINSQKITIHFYGGEKLILNSRENIFVEFN